MTSSSASGKRSGVTKIARGSQTVTRYPRKRPTVASAEAKSMAPKTYMAGRGTKEETNTSWPPASTTPLSPRVSNGRAAASTSSAGSPAREITRGPPSGSPPTVVR